MIIRFSTVVLDTKNFLLTRNGNEESVEPQVFNLINYLVEHRASVVSRNQLLDDLWQGKVVSDATLSNHIKKARLVLGDTAEQQAIIKTVRSRGYKFVAEIQSIESTASTLATPTYEPTATHKSSTAAQVLPAIHSSPDEIQQDKNNPSDTIQRIFYGLTVCIGLLLGYSLFHQFIVTPTQVRHPINTAKEHADLKTTPLLPAELSELDQRSLKNIPLENSIAVLPFKNRSNLEEDVYFTEGIHDDLLSRISQVPEIATISRTSVARYQHTQPNIQQIGAELNVANILEGGVQRAGDQIRINVQLIKVQTNEAIWAETYTRAITVENIFEIQSNIVETITEQLKIALSEEQKNRINQVPTQNLTALQAWFKGREHVQQNTSDGRAAALKHFTEATKLDPKFAEAYAEIALIQLDTIYHSAAASDTKTDLARPNIETALMLDPQSATALTAFAELQIQQKNYSAAEATFKKIIQSHTNFVEAYVRYANMLNWRMRESQKAIVLFEKALELNPNDKNIPRQLAEALMAANRSTEAVKVMQVAVNKFPLDPHTHHTLGLVYSWGLSKDDQAIKHLRHAIALDPNSAATVWMLGETYQVLGDTKNAVFWLSRLPQNAEDLTSVAYYLGVLERARGNHDRAMYYFDQVAVHKASPASMALYALAKNDIDNGTPQKAVDRYLQRVPQLAQPNPEVDGFLFAYITGYAESLIALEHNRKAQNILSDAESFTYRGGTTVDWYPENAALYWVLSGNKKKAIAVLQNHADQGRYINFVGDNIAYHKMLTVYKALQHEPEFIQLVQHFNQRINEQIQNLEQWEQDGSMPPIPLQLQSITHKP